MERQAKILAQKVKHQLHYEVTLESLGQCFEALGYSLLFYGKEGGRFPTKKGNKVLAFIEKTDYAARSNAFIYNTSEHKIVFLKSGFSEYHTTFLLAHELYHALRHHDSNPVLYYVERQQDNAANFFAAWLLDETLLAKELYLLKHYAKALLLVLAALGLCLALAFTLKPASGPTPPGGNQPPPAVEANTAQLYYITPAGQKYHMEGCRYLQGKNSRQVTWDEIQQRRYQPCAVCIPTQ